MASHDALQYRCLHTTTLVSAKHFNSTSTIASYTLHNAKDPVVWGKWRYSNIKTLGKTVIRKRKKYKI